MAVERDFNAERSARIDLLMTEARRMTLVPTDRTERQAMCTRLDAAMRDLGARVPVVNDRDSRAVVSRSRTP